MTGMPIAPTIASMDADTRSPVRIGALAADMQLLQGDRPAAGSATNRGGVSTIRRRRPRAAALHHQGEGLGVHAPGDWRAPSPTRRWRGALFVPRSAPRPQTRGY